MLAKYNRFVSTTAVTTNPKIEVLQEQLKQDVYAAVNLNILSQDESVSLEYLEPLQLRLIDLNSDLRIGNLEVEVFHTVNTQFGVIPNELNSKKVKITLFLDKQKQGNESNLYDPTYVLSVIKQVYPQA